MIEPVLDLSILNQKRYQKRKDADGKPLTCSAVQQTSSGKEKRCKQNVVRDGLCTNHYMQRRRALQEGRPVKFTEPRKRKEHPTEHWNKG